MRDTSSDRYRELVRAERRRHGSGSKRMGRTRLGVDVWADMPNDVTREQLWEIIGVLAFELNGALVRLDVATLATSRRRSPGLTGTR